MESKMQQLFSLVFPYRWDSSTDLSKEGNKQQINEEPQQEYHDALGDLKIQLSAGIAVKTVFS